MLNRWKKDHFDEVNTFNEAFEKIVIEME